MINFIIMNILGLHGYRQSGEIMEKRLTKIFGRQENIIICPNGPINVEESLFGWWPIRSKDTIHELYGYGDLTSLFESFRQYSEVDYLVGFSQGSVLATLLVAHNIINPKRIILFSGLDIVDIQYRIPRNTISIPTLMFIGQNDPISPAEYCIKLSHYYQKDQIKILGHKGGHIIPNISLKGLTTMFDTPSDNLKLKLGVNII